MSESHIHLEPTGDDRIVALTHREWGALWHLQFPEGIDCREGAIMAWPLFDRITRSL